MHRNEHVVPDRLQFAYDYSLAKFTIEMWTNNHTT